MALRLDDRWIWDSWVADDGDRYHLFFLQAPRSLGDVGLRHTNASIGHARSRDLVEWEVLPDALHRDPDGWDDLALWTGSVVRGDDGRWRMFYTAINTRGHGVQDQRVGVALSDDLVTWHREVDRPVLEVDGRWYRSLDDDPTASETWRDPFVFRDPEGDGWHLLLAARDLEHGRNDNGVIAHARSDDLAHWELQPPVALGGHGFGQLEVAQVREIDGRPVLVFTCQPAEQTDARRAAVGDWCTWAVVGEPGASPVGPWDVAKAQPFTAEPALFAAPLVQRRDPATGSGRPSGWSFVGFRNLEPEGVEALEIIDPVPVHLEGDRLVADDGYVSPPGSARCARPRRPAGRRPRRR